MSYGSTPLARISSSGGSTVIDDTSEVSGVKGFAIITGPDGAVIDILTGKDADGESVDWKTEKNLVTLHAGIPYMLPKDCYFDTIQLSSGYVVVYE